MFFPTQVELEVNAFGKANASGNLPVIHWHTTSLFVVNQKHRGKRDFNLGPDRVTCSFSRYSFPDLPSLTTPFRVCTVVHVHVIVDQPEEPTELPNQDPRSDHWL